MTNAASSAVGRGESGFSRRSLCIVALTVLSSLLLVALWKLFPVQEHLRDATLWIDQAGPLGVLVFGLVYVIASLIGIPRVPMHIGAGV